MAASPDDAARILIVDDDPLMRQMLIRYFEQEGYRISGAANAAEMRAQLIAKSHDVILLDIVMPGEDGLTLAREIRTRSDVGIIMLTGRDELLDRVVGLEVGADDYVVKPFQLRELLARVRSVLRRRKSASEIQDPANETIRFDGWVLDTGRRHLISPEGEDVTLTTGEFDILVTLARRPGRVFNRETLMDLTRRRNYEAYDRTIDAQIARLRRKIEADSRNPAFVKSVRGVGYVFAGKIGQ
jgi:two-component system, OmpR family, response regulator